MSPAELWALRLRVRRLEHEAEIAARLASFADGGHERERIYHFIASESDNFPLSSLCRACRVSRSAYYAWLQKAPRAR